MIGAILLGLQFGTDAEIISSGEQESLPRFGAVFADKVWW